MLEANLISIFTEPLNRAGIQYMVTGSVASILYGQPRMTHDIDLVINLPGDTVKTLEELFPEDQFYCPPIEVMRLEVARDARGQFNIIHHDSGFKADIYPVCKDDLHKWAMAKRRELTLGKHSVWVAPPEYVIVRKLDYYREGQSQKHLIDIRKMLDFSGDKIDQTTLKEKIAQLGLESQWHQAQGQE